MILDSTPTHVGFVLVAHDMMYTDTAIDFVKALNYASEVCGYKVTITHHKGSVLADARQKAIKDAVDAGCDYVFCVDADMRIPVNVIDGMIQTMKDNDVMVLAANCSRRKRPLGPTARVKNHYIGGDSEPLWPEDPDVEKIEQVEAIGFGVIMIDTKVFHEIRWPWFGQPWHEEGQKFVGEDIFFCGRLHEKGIGIWIDHQLSWAVKHIGTYEYGMADVMGERQLAESGAWGDAVL